MNRDDATHLAMPPSRNPAPPLPALPPRAIPRPPPDSPIINRRNTGRWWFRWRQKRARLRRGGEWERERERYRISCAREIRREDTRRYAGEKRSPRSKGKVRCRCVSGKRSFRAGVRDKRHGKSRRESAFSIRRNERAIVIGVGWDRRGVWWV